MKKKFAPARSALQRRTVGWHRLVPFAALWMLTLAAYSNSFQAGLIYDNAAIVGKDIRLRTVSIENVRLILTDEYWYPNAGNGLYRPFTTLTYLFNYAVLGAGSNRQFLSPEYKLSAGAKRVMRSLGAADSVARWARANCGSIARAHRGTARGLQIIKSVSDTRLYKQALAVTG